MEWILDYRHDALTPIFLGLTFLGDVTFFLVVLPLGFWLWRRESFLHLTVLLCVTGMLNAVLKDFFQVPRPDEIPHLVEIGGWSFPSGHAQVGAVMWGWLAWEVRRRWFAAVAALVIAGIAASRVYLGVHRPVDVFAGATLGLVTVAFAQWILAREDFWEHLDGRRRAAAVAVLVLLAVLVLPGRSHSTIPAAVLLGFWIAQSYERRTLGWQPPDAWSRRAMAGVLGLAGAVVLRAALKLLFAAGGFPDLPADFTRYALIGAWIGFGAPWTFERLGLRHLGLDREP